jgi:hypothetical protein
VEVSRGCLSRGVRGVQVGCCEILVFMGIGVGPIHGIMQHPLVRESLQLGRKAVVAVVFSQVSHQERTRNDEQSHNKCCTCFAVGVFGC